MALCVLDDLVPSIRCNRVFLEPINAIVHQGTKAYSDFKVSIDLSVYDRVDDHEGIADYLFRDSFQKYVKIKYVFCNNKSLNLVIDFLRTMGLSGSSLTFVVDKVTGNIGGSSIVSEMVEKAIEKSLENKEIVPLTSRLRNQSHKATYVNLLTDFYSATIITDNVYDGEISFANYTNDFIESHGQRIYDENGNIFYDLKIPKEHLQFISRTSVNDIYFHAWAYFDINAAYVDKGIYNSGIDIFTKETVKYYFNDIHNCRILINKKIVEPYVQDFRLIERIGEIIQDDRISDYDQAVTSISLLTGKPDLLTTDITSDLFSSYKLDEITVETEVLSTATTAAVESSNLSTATIPQGGSAYTGLRADSVSNSISNPNINSLTVNTIDTNSREILTVMTGRGGNPALAPSNTPAGTPSEDSAAPEVSSTSKTYNRLYTRNTFYFNMHTFFMRKTKFPFMYLPLFSPPINSYFTNSKADPILMLQRADILSMNVFRYREDGSDKKLVATKSTIVELDLPNGAPLGIRGFIFDDIGFKNLTHGKYYYSVEMQLKDPMEDLIENLAASCHNMLNALTMARSYIHNNAKEYNEMRDELSQTAKNKINSILSVTANSFFPDFKVLFAIMTNQRFSDVSLALDDLSVVALERRKVENLHRVVEDLLFHVGKFYETKDMYSSPSQGFYNLSSFIKPSSEISYSRIWKRNLMDAKADQAGMLDILENYFTGYYLTTNGYNIRTTIETQKHQAPTGQTSVDIGYLTPNKIDDIEIFDLNDNDTSAFMALFLNMLEKPDLTENERSMMAALLSTNNNYDFTVSELKNNTGMFESFITDQGVSVFNLAAEEEETSFKKTPKDVIRGIDGGRNLGYKEERGGFLFSHEEDDSDLNLEEKQELALSSLRSEFAKKELLISKALRANHGYSILDRKDFTQGTSQRKRYHLQNINNRLNHAHNFGIVPNFYDYYAHKLIDADRPNLYTSALNRFLVDNVFIVYYLNGFDSNMNPQWRHLTNFETIKQNKGTNGALLCKLERYKSDVLLLGDGAMSDREILSKYFYLK